MIEAFTNKHKPFTNTKILHRVVFIIKTVETTINLQHHIKYAAFLLRWKRYEHFLPLVIINISYICICLHNCYLTSLLEALFVNFYFVLLKKKNSIKKNSSWNQYLARILQNSLFSGSQYFSWISLNGKIFSNKQFIAAKLN